MPINIKKRQALSVLTVATLVFSSYNDVESIKHDATYLQSIDASNLTTGNRAMTMFEDNENPPRMYDKTDRWFRMNELMQVIQKGKYSVQISLYSPTSITDVRGYAKLPNYDKRFLIYNFTKVPAFHRSFHQIPTRTGKHDYLLENGNTVTIDKIDNFPQEAIEFSVESSDPLFAKFKKIISRHLVQFNDKCYLNNPKYEPMNPVLAKDANVLLINFSYALSRPIYYNTFINYDKYLLQFAATAGTLLVGAKDWQGNKEDKDRVYDYLTKAEIEKIYWSYLDDRTIHPAMEPGGTTWGGGPRVSDREDSCIRGQYIGETYIWMHEYGHHMGWQHISNFTFESGGTQGLEDRFKEFINT